MMSAHFWLQFSVFPTHRNIVTRDCEDTERTESYCWSKSVLFVCLKTLWSVSKVQRKNETNLRISFYQRWFKWSRHTWDMYRYKPKINQCKCFHVWGVDMPLMWVQRNFWLTCQNTVAVFFAVCCQLVVWIQALPEVLLSPRSRHLFDLGLGARSLSLNDLEAAGGRSRTGHDWLVSVMDVRL